MAGIHTWLGWKDFHFNKRLAHSSVRCGFLFIVCSRRKGSGGEPGVRHSPPLNWTYFNAQVHSHSLQEWPDEVVCHPNSVLTMNGFLSFWLDDIMTLHTLNYRHTLLPLQPAQGEKKESPGHGKKESERLSGGGSWWGQKCPYLVISAWLFNSTFLLCAVKHRCVCFLFDFFLAVAVLFVSVILWCVFVFLKQLYFESSSCALVSVCVFFPPWHVCALSASGIAQALTAWPLTPRLKYRIFPIHSKEGARVRFIEFSREACWTCSVLLCKHVMASR